MGLIGLIIGFGFASWARGSLPSSTVVRQPQVAQAPAVAPIQPLQQPQAVPEPSPSAATVPPIDSQKDRILGNPKAEVAIVQYSDYECPFSKRVQATYEQIIGTYGDKVMVVFRHFPLGFHPNAEPAAIAAECAGELGGNDAFWKMTKAIFDAQGEWAYEKYAGDIGLNVEKFKACVTSDKFKQYVQDNLTGGSSAGVNGTPANFVVNLKTQKQQLISGAQPFENFKTVIDAML